MQKPVQYVKRSFNAATKSLTEAVEMLDFLLFGFRTFKAAKADGGGINWKDFPKLISLVDPADVAFEGAEKIPTELANATSDQLDEILDHLNEGLDIQDQYNRETLNLVGDAAVPVYALLRHLNKGRQDEPASGDKVDEKPAPADDQDGFAPRQ